VKLLFLFTLISACAANVWCQHPAGNERCPVFMRVPADVKTDVVIEERLWFELRQCKGATVRLIAYERQSTRPSLAIDTGSTYPSFVAHMFNILVLESFGGSANHVLVVGFRKGKAAVLLDRPAGGRIQIERSEKALTVAVPPKTFPDDLGRFPNVQAQRYIFDLEY
jgi:hypothetical protein